MFYKDFKKPNIHGPRYRRKRLNSINPDTISYIRSVVPECEGLSDSEIRRIIVTFNTELWRKVVEYRDGVEIPAQIGHVFVGSCKPVKSKINTDIEKSIIYDKRISHQNYESDSYVAKIFFTTFANKYKFKNHHLWAFAGHRTFTRTVSANYKNNWNKYVLVEPYMKVSAIYKKALGEERRQQEQQDLLKNYNEFDL
jgi:hypothetical protein